MRDYSRAFSLIEEAIREGLTANETYKMLKEAGEGYRRQDFLADYRRLSGKPKKEDAWKYTPTKYKKKRRYKTAKPQKKKFYSYVEARLLDEQTGGVYRRRFIIPHDKELSENEIEKLAIRRIQNYLNKAMQYERQKVLSVRVVGTTERID